MLVLKYITTPLVSAVNDKIIKLFNICPRKKLGSMNENHLFPARGSILRFDSCMWILKKLKLC